MDIDTDGVGGNTTSDSVSTSETDDDSTTNSLRELDYSSSTLNCAYGPGGVVTGGTQTDGDTDSESSTVTVNDSSSDSSTGSETDSEVEGANDSTDTIADTEDDTDSDNETDTDTGSSGEQDTIVLGADMDELSGTASDSESDTATDSDTNIDTAATTTAESSSYSETVGGETTTDSELDTSTETDTTTDTDDDTPTNTEDSGESDGAAAIMLSGYSTDTVDDTPTLGESDDDVDVNTSTETLSDGDDADSDNGSSDKVVTTSTGSETMTGSDSDPDTLTDVDSQILGLAGVITGGSIDSAESGTGTGSWDTSGGGSDTDTDIVSGDEEDTGDAADESESTQESGSYTSSGSSDDGSTESDSTSEDLGDGGVVVDGGTTESSSESDDSGDTSTETDGMTDQFSDTSSEVEGADTDSGSDSGTDTTTETDTAGSTLIDTVSENLGADGTVADGDESDSLDEFTGDTTTETDYPTETVTDSVSDVTMTLTETNTTTDTDDEADEDWACETLGTSAVISGGSDCFTVGTLDDSSYVSSGSGPENYNDTSGSPNGTATVNGSGSSSDFVDQTFGDTLRKGGDVASGSLSYTVDTSDSDAQTKTEENGPETMADELSGGPSQTASNTIDTTTGDDDTAYEMGTETLGGGGTISGGSDSVSWSDGDSNSRDLTINGIDTDLSINEDSTDTYGFAESGTETITAGGGDAPCTLNFVWTQMGTDNYQLDQGNTSGSSSYGLDLTDTVSSSWQDSGADVLTNSDSVTGQTDSFQWNQFDSLTDGVTEDDGGPVSGEGAQLFSVTDAGSETLAAEESHPGSLTVAAESDQFDIQDAFSADSSRSGSWSLSDAQYGDTAQGSVTVSTAGGYSFDDAGNDSLSDSSSTESDSYDVTDWEYSSESYTNSGEIPEGTWGTGTYLSDSDGFSSYSLLADGTDSVSGGDDDSTMSHDSGVSGSSTDSWSYSVPVAYGGLPVYDGDGFDEGLTFLDFEASPGQQSYWAVGTGYIYDLGPFTWSSTDGNDYLSAVISAPVLPEGGGPGGWEDASDGSPLSMIEKEQFSLGEITLASELGTLYLSGSRVVDDNSGSGNPTTSSGSGAPPEYVVPNSAPVYLSGSALDLGVAKPGYLPYGSTFGVTPSTNAATPLGLPDQEATAVDNMAQDQGPPDGVSRSAPPSPTSTLIALAAAGRNPTDITIPTQGSEGTGTGSSSGSGSSGSGSGSGGSSGGGSDDAVRANGSAASTASGSGVMVAQGAISLPSGSGTAAAGSASGAASGASTTGSSTGSSGASGATGEADAGSESGASGPTQAAGSAGQAALGQTVAADGVGAEEDEDDRAHGSMLDASSYAVSKGIYNVGAGVGMFAWDLVAVPYDVFFGTQHSYYASATAEALRQGASVPAITGQVAANVGTLGLKGLVDSAQNYYETGDPTQFQEYSGSFLAGALTAKGLKDAATSKAGRTPAGPAPKAPPRAVPSIKVNTPPNAADLTIGELLPDLPDDAMIHLSPEAAESFAQGANPDSYFVRYGDVKHLTVGRYKGEVVLPLAPAFDVDAATFVIKRQPSPGMFGPAPEGAGEYLNKGVLVPDEIVTIPPIPAKLRPPIFPPPSQ